VERSQFSVLEEERTELSLGEERYGIHKGKNVRQGEVKFEIRISMV
jgi:hypothetical protein